jgi:hypothetical protein
MPRLDGQDDPPKRARPMTALLRRQFTSPWRGCDDPVSEHTNALYGKLHAVPRKNLDCLGCAERNNISRVEGAISGSKANNLTWLELEISRVAFALQDAVDVRRHPQPGPNPLLNEVRPHPRPK